MFAVKGWSVDAKSLKPQTEVFKSAKAANELGKKSRKRKRKNEQEVVENGNNQSLAVEQTQKQPDEDSEVSKADKKKSKKRRKLEAQKDAEPLPNEKPDAVRQSDVEEKVDRWEDIVLGTRAEKLGLDKRKKKKKKSLLTFGSIEPEGNKEDDQHVGNQKKDSEQHERSKKYADTNGEHHAKKINGQAEALIPPPANLTPMQSAMRQKLVSARFRHLNQTLYTEPSSKAKALFDQNPEMFEDYHAGFRQQVSVWPENPLDKFIVAIRHRAKIKPVSQVKPKKRKANAKVKMPPKDPGHALPRTDGISTIADLGCGDARLAYTLTVSGDTTALNLKLHSFDLHGTTKYVTKADIAKLPLKDESVNVAILCLSLMGTNWTSFIEEAHRILRWKGELWVAEIKSRFGRVSKSGRPVEHSVGGKRKQAAAQKAQETKAKEQEEVDEQEVLQTAVDGVLSAKEETDVSAFVQVLKRRGFIVKPPSEKHIDLKNKMFVKMEFVKALTPIKGKGKPDASERRDGSKMKFFSDEDANADTDEETEVLKPCLYKTR